MRALITGAGGFVGGHLARHLEAAGDEVVRCDLEVDVTDLDQVRRVLEDTSPSAVYHLAALAHVGDSWKDPERYLAVNAGGTATVLDAVAEVVPAARVLVVSSSEVYGLVTPEQLPLAEDAPLQPVSPYATSKVAAEEAAWQAASSGIEVVVARPFNHIGPGQALSFAVAAFAQRIAEAVAEGAGSLVVGDLSARRDFTDVRDVVAAYRLLVLEGRAGEAYNVCSGHDVSMAEVIDRLLELAGVELRLEVDPALLRPVEIPVLRGDASKLRAATAWVPAIALVDSLADVLAAT
jgi:GDP-4-dehydro-6-deoxy-D-mannose reductase